MRDTAQTPSVQRWLLIALALILFAAIALRLPHLDLRPMHNDEAVNAVNFTRPLWEKGVYVYDPNEYHGPSLHFAALPFLWLSPAREFSQVNETILRLVPVFFGLGLVVLLWWLRDGLGAAATLWAGLLTAISPAMVFYSRYYIHEILLVCFTMLVLVAGWRYSRRPRFMWAVIGGAGLGLMHATKETFVIPVASMGLAVLATALWWRQKEAMPEPPPGGPRLSEPQHSQTKMRLLFSRIPSWISGNHVAAALCAAFLVSVLLFTDFFRHPSGWLDSFRSYMPWLHRAGGHSPHIHPFAFYLERLAFFRQGGGPVWSEGLILLLAVMGSVAAFTGRGLAGANVWFARFLAAYTITLTLAYSLISYKTPWCMLGFLHGMILLAGLGAAALVQLVRSRALQITAATLIVAAAAQLGWQAWRSDSYDGEPRDQNPYAYSQTVPNLLDLVEKVEAIAKVHPEGHQMLIKVMAPESDYWPLPWYLRQFKRVGWWDHLPDDPSAPVMVVGAKLCAALDERPEKTWSALGLYGLRPETLLQLCVEPELWRRYLEASSRK